MLEIQNVALLAADAVLYFTVLATLLRLRHRLGLGPFFCALGVMHFLETYLASILYVGLPLGIVTSPGSTVLFTGKLIMLLLLYIREDARIVRQPIYGLLLGNVLLFALAFVLRHHNLVTLVPGREADFAFLNEMGALMVWGTAVLFFDCVLMIILYEHSRTWFGDRLYARLLVTGGLIMSFDQLAFFAGLHILTGAGLQVLLGGWAAKMGAVVLYGGLGAVYLRYVDPRRARPSAPRLIDVFDTLTYRERYEDLLARTGFDALTGALDRGYLEGRGREVIEQATRDSMPVSLILIDIDHFKDFNDDFGHAAGDVALKRICHNIASAIRVGDMLFRFGGEEFVVITVGLSDEQTFALGERIRRRIAADVDAATRRLTASIGVVSRNADAPDYDAMFALADQRLYHAKASGRDCTVGDGSLTADGTSLQLLQAR